MPAAPALNTSADNMLHQLFGEWVSFMFFILSWTDPQLPELLEVFFDPLDYVVTTILVQGNSLAIRESLRFLFTPLADVLLDLLLVSRTTLLI